MKTMLIWFIGFLGIAGWFFWMQTRTACNTTFEYSLGTIDPRFEMTNDEVLEIMQSVESMWEAPIGIDLFTYNPDSDFQIHFIYDERQERTEKSQIIDDSLETLEDAFQDAKTEHDTFKKKYDREFADYESQFNSYNVRMQKLNTDIQYWNRQGGAPSDIYADLQSEQELLSTELIEIKQKEKELNTLRQELNSLAFEANRLREKYNEAAMEHNTLYGGEREFSQGTWFSDRIEIYEFESPKHLKLVLAHELGHALGLEHVEDEKAIMYYLMENQNLSDRAVTNADIEALEMFCENQNIFERLGL